MSGLRAAALHHVVIDARVMIKCLQARNGHLQMWTMLGLLGPPECRGQLPPPAFPAFRASPAHAGQAHGGQPGVRTAGGATVSSQQTPEPSLQPAAMAEADWESSKENFQPLKTGRKAAALRDTTAELRAVAVEEQRR